MAYIIGLLTEEEAKELERRGWELEDPPKSLIPPSLNKRKKFKDSMFYRMVWVDNDMFSIMDGPDWEKGNGST